VINFFRYYNANPLPPPAVPNVVHNNHPLNVHFDNVVVNINISPDSEDTDNDETDHDSD
jgi:hypothetical protein